jgi:hypothetical protein
MKRRKLLVGLGSLSAGGAAALGTSAFTSVSADRQVAVSVADDASALLRLAPVPGSGNESYVEVEDGELTIDISDSNDSVLGDGVNAGATTIFADLFRIENQGTQIVYVWLLESGGRNGSKRHAFYAGSWAGDAPARAVSVADFNNGLANTRPRELKPQYDAGVETQAAELGVGDAVDVGLVVDVPSGSAGSAVLKDGQTVTINATAEKASLADVFTPAYDP